MSSMSERDIAAFRLERSATVVALVDALRSIPPESAPSARAVTQAVREQIYFGYEKPMAKARGALTVWGKYECDRPWSVAAAELFTSGTAQRGQRLLNRDHVWPVGAVVRELMACERSVEATADLLDQRLVTCTVLASEHAKLGRVPRELTGWERYEAAEISVVDRLP